MLHNKTITCTCAALALCAGYCCSESIAGMQAGQNDCQPPERPLGEEGGKIIEMEFELAKQGSLTFAGGPAPELTLHGSQKFFYLTHRFSKELDEVGPTSLEAYPVTLTFYTRRLKPDSAEVITVDPSDIWCLARRGDLVLLSDRITHHMTHVYEVDRDKNEIHFADKWPDEFFLLEGLNEAGVSARKTLRKDGKKLLTITKNEFLLLALALSTRGEGQIADYVQKLIPEAEFDPSVHRAVGLSFLNAVGYPYNERFLDDSVVSLEKALELAKREEREDIERQIASELYLAIRIDHANSNAVLKSYVMKGQLRPKLYRHIEELRHKRDKLLREYKENYLLSDFSANDFFRLGFTEVSLRDWDAIIAYFDRAIAMDPEYDEAYIYRGIAKLRKRQVRGAIADATLTIELLTERQQNLEEYITRHFPRHAVYGKEKKSLIRRLIKHRMRKAYEIRSEGYLELGLEDPGNDDLAAMKKLRRLDLRSADFEVGKKALNRGDVETAFRHWLPLAKAGNGNAQSNIGNLYAGGPEQFEGGSREFRKEFRRDPAEARKWWLLAAKQGHRGALFNLGMMFVHGDGGEPNKPKGYMFLKLAKKHGNRDAAEVLKEVTESMTPEEVSEGESLFREWDRETTDLTRGPGAR